jgi:RimJ/RimL family protein N-acetyltransferase
MITEASFIDFKCPYCGEPVSFPQATAGFSQECPICGEALIVPKDGSDEGRKLPIPITTARLILRRLRTADWTDLHEFLSQDELCKYGGGAPMEEKEIIHWLESDRKVKLTTSDDGFYLGIELREGGKLIGYVKLDFVDPKRLQGWIYVVVSPSYQRNGVATEAISALLDFCFKEIAMHRVTAWHDSRDLLAGALCAKVGLRREGEFLKDQQINDEWINSVYYALLGEEYLNAGNNSVA